MMNYLSSFFSSLITLKTKAIRRSAANPLRFYTFIWFFFNILFNRTLVWWLLSFLLLSGSEWIAWYCKKLLISKCAHIKRINLQRKKIFKVCLGLKQASRDRETCVETNVNTWQLLQDGNHKWTVVSKMASANIWTN